ncbi:antitrypsin [Acyrthosiphon pisum]|uniref:Serpin domain-containing protein n=1 Tax=Acyrthosiphon pisum TaxID=7029 RepID=A0A8R1W128_ACYPI|nr:antitrypsin [Acyrthosiphon pisum]|eukprot:XP_001944367.1 PREDICTED: leukocyte elastase inhibitor [Acyrthosiphon pisum]
MTSVSLAAAAVGLCVLAITVSGQLEQENDISKTTEIMTDVLLKATSDDNFNYVVSPFASSVILALAAEGADSETKSQLVATLGGELPDKNSYKEVLSTIKGYSLDGFAQNKVVLKNFLYVYKNYSVHESYAQLARDYYLTDVRSVARPDLEMKRAATNNIAADDDESTADFKEHALLIFNGLSLEMTWPKSTWHKTSMSWNGKVVKAFGAAGNFAIAHIPSLECTALKLPYKNTDYALLVLLPKNKDVSLNEVLKKLKPENGIEKLTKAMTIKPSFVTMPCFQSSNITHLKTVLQQGTQTNSVFTESADLSKLSSDKLYLDDVVQQANLRVCVDGTSSSALTSSAFTSQRVIKESVVMDRPFAYALYNVANGIVYAAGKLEQPVWEDTDDDGNGSDIETIDI